MHTPSTSDSERVFWGGQEETEVGGVPCLKELWKYRTFTCPGFPHLYHLAKVPDPIHADSGYFITGSPTSTLFAR